MALTIHTLDYGDIELETSFLVLGHECVGQCIGAIEIDRLAMMRYGIDDIRWLHAGDLRFQEQF